MPRHREAVEPFYALSYRITFLSRAELARDYVVTPPPGSATTTCPPAA
ncbi:hypothetical protein [Nocardioides humi]|uniref:Uncharacterized protein n=1 Tax=Nocardioides humi TaxID=449461 RepID=A0ABN2AUS5_9ACTN|nr:hypothetical protein [Nocardioides humi]